MVRACWFFAGAGGRGKGRRVSPRSRPRGEKKAHRTDDTRSPKKNKQTGTVHVWVTRGRGGLTADPREVAAAGHAPSLYVSVSAETSRRDGAHATPLDRTRGWRAATSPVPPAPPYFGALLGNARADMAVAQAEARGRGYDCALLVDEEGCLVGAPHAAVALVTEAGELVVVPGGDRAPRALTLERLAALVPVVRERERESWWLFFILCFRVGWRVPAVFFLLARWDEEPQTNQTYHHLSPDQKA